MDQISNDVLNIVFGFLSPRDMLNARLVGREWKTASERVFFERVAIALSTNAPLMLEAAKEDSSFQKKMSCLLQEIPTKENSHQSLDEHRNEVYKFRVTHVFSPVNSLTYICIRMCDKNPGLLTNFIECGAPVNGLNSKGPSPLQIAVDEGLPIATLKLLEGGADPDRPGNKEKVPLYYALQKAASAEKGSPAAKNALAHAKYLIMHGAKVESWVLQDFKSLVEADSDLGLLCGKKANPLTPEEEGDNELHKAVRRGYPAGVQFFAKVERFKDAINTTGASPLSLALLPVHLQSTWGQEIVLELLRAGVSPNTSQPETYLHRAVAYDKGDIVTALLERGANANAQDGMRNTPLHSAAAKGLHGVAKLLLAKNANPNLLNINGFSPLHLAVLNRDLELVRIMLDWEQVRVDQGSHEGSTALHCATQQGLDEIAQLLVDYGADPEKENVKGEVAKGSLQLTKSSGPKQPSNAPKGRFGVPHFLAIMGIACLALGLRWKVWEKLPGFRPATLSISVG